MSLRRRRILFFSVVKERAPDEDAGDVDAITTEADVAITTEADENLVME